MKKIIYTQKDMNIARDIYLKHGGVNHKKIASEIRARGVRFDRSRLYTLRRGGGVQIGWPEKYGWRSMLTASERAKLGQKGRRRHNFEHWLRTNFPKWTWSERYKRYIYNHLADITEGRSERLMIFMPPRHGKSETVTVRYTAWRLLCDPSLNVIIGSYNQRLADSFSRKVRRIFCELSPAPKDGAFSKDRIRTASEWETPAGGVVRSVGVGAGIAGFGAGLIVIDDPVRNRSDAESVVYRRRVWEWFNDDIYTRMEPDAALILVQTRWHQDDLAGRLLREMADGGDKWNVVCLPALCEGESIKDKGESEERGAANLDSSLGSLSLTPHPLSSTRDPIGRRPGAALWPKRYPVKALLRYKRKLGSYSFSALYQQSPSPAEGGTFKRAWFEKIIDEAPPNLRWKRGYDLAVSTKTTADFTASFRCAFDKQGNLYIADGFRDRIEYPEQRRMIGEFMKSEKMTEHGIERAAHAQACVQDLRRDLTLRRYPMRLVPVNADKLTRALSWLNLAEEGKLFLVRGPWIDEFVDEIARFPRGRHDDQIDAVSVAVQMLTAADRRLHIF